MVRFRVSTRMMWPQPVSSVAVVLVVAAAVVWDLKSRRVPNALTLGGAVAAIVVAGFTQGWPGVLRSGAGWVTGAALFFPLFALGGMGAGDVKLLAAIGAWLGPIGAVWAGLYGAVAGGVMALAVALGRGYAGVAVRNVGAMLRLWSAGGVQRIDGLTLADKTSVRLPYALPLAVGALLAIWTA